MTGTPVLSDNAKTAAQPASKPDEVDMWPPPERHGTSVYADYWRERSGFFTVTPKVDDKGARGGKTR